MGFVSACTCPAAKTYRPAGEREPLRQGPLHLHRMIGADRSLVTVGRSFTVAKGFSPLRNGGFAVPFESLLRPPSLLLGLLSLSGDGAASMEDCSSPCSLPRTLSVIGGNGVQILMQPRPLTGSLCICVGSCLFLLSVR